MEPRLMAKYKDGMHHKGYFRGGGIIYINLITCKDKIVILSKLQIYVLHWYHAYLLHPGMDRTEAMIRQLLYLPDIIYAVQKELTNCDTCHIIKNMDNYQLS